MSVGWEILRIFKNKTPRRTVILEKQMVTRLVKKFPAFYGTRMFITVFKGPAIWPYPELLESIPHAH